MADVSVVTHGNGDVSIGAEIDGAFVPFASHSKGRVAQLVERGKDLNERAKAGDEQAIEILGDSFKPSRSRKSASKADEPADEPKPEGS